MVFHVVAGLSTTSLAAFSGIFFRKAQLSGIITIIAALLLAVIAQLSAKAGTGFVVVLSLIFPPMNYVYFLDLLARWESEDKPLNFFKTGPKTNKSSFAIPAVVFFIFALYQTFVYPIMGALIEQRFYESTSAGRRTVISQSEVAVNLNGFTKEYTPGWMVRALCFWTKRPMESVIAVDNLTLQAWRGEILVLLGANGSGKSTTLDAVAGLRSISSGEISINYHHPHEGFGKKAPTTNSALSHMLIVPSGHCPQSNIFWDDLTVREHIQIFDGIKSNGKTASQNDIKSLIKSCDLTKKSADLAKSLSGGQKRKLQMAMMFAGGSTVCCVDEVSSGVDPLSRRKLWDILLAERGRRSIILTTHFLDEADLLADRIAILSNGLLKASGTSVELKHRLGSGYRVHMHHVRGASKPPVYSDILYTEEDHETIYFPSNSTDTHHFLQRLEYDGVKNYEVKGPTLEDVFFKIEGKTLAASAQRSSFDSGSPLVGDNAKKSELLSDLGNAKRVGMAKQITTLGAKRFMIFQRNPIPYIAALLIVLIAAGCSTLFLKADSIGGCDPTTAISSSYGDQNDLGSKLKLVVGPEAQLTQAAMEKIAAAPPGAVTKANSLDEFNAAVQRRYLELIPGAFFLGDQPTIAWQADATPGYAFITQNLVNSLLFNITIESTYGVLEMPFVVDLSGQLLFIAYFGLSMAVYPAFLSLYPTMERLCGVRAMHYSNGVRALPLWLAYLLFDSSFIVSMSSISVIIFVATSDVWYAMGYLFLIFLLYGISSTLYSYVISLFSKSQLAAFAITAATQAAFFVVYFVIFMVVFTYTEGSRQTSTLNIAYFTLATASPVVSLARALYLTVNVFGISCRDKKYASYPGAIDLYGGPILYLVLQSLVFFGILFWKESGSTLQLWRKRKAAGPGKDSIELEAPVEFASATKASDGLRVMSLRKEFKKHLAVDNITFGIPRSECFALVGPNGAGKSTTISMIRGDAHPTGHDSEIFIEGVSAIQHRSKARSRLGVCPQIDPLDTLTVSEHLQFYAKIRGISDPLQNTEMIMKAVGLEPFANRIATRLSGGNKRKLSLGIAMVGNPSVIVLDEPSSGMDALSKRIMWRTLSSITPGRSLLLTTHSMEEADALATRAGIVASRMLAFGTTEELRSRYGNAYFVNLVHSHAPHTSAAEMHSMERWVKYEFPEATLDGWMGYGQVKFEVPLRGSSGHSSLADIFGKLEEAKTGLDVQYYSVSMATLDQVFLDVVGRHVAMQEE